MKRNLILGVLLVVLTIMTAGCEMASQQSVTPTVGEPTSAMETAVPSTSAASQPQYGGTIHTAAIAAVSTLDPALGWDLLSWNYEEMLFDGLVYYREGSTEIVPHIAESFGVTPDGKFTFHLRPGVKFTNGREVTADDFKYSLERVLDPETQSPGAGFFGSIVGAQAFRDGEATEVAGIEVLDEYTLRIALEEPDVSFLHILATPFAYVVPEEEVAEYGEDFARNPIGTGPFILDKWEPGQLLRLKKNPEYFLEELPYLDAVEIRENVGEEAMALMFEKEETDIFNIASPALRGLMTDPRWQSYVVCAPTLRTRAVIMNVEMSPFDDIRVRQAVNYSLRKERIAEIAGPNTMVASGILPPTVSGYDPTLEGYQYDATKAKELLAEAGYPDGFEIPMWAKSSESWLRLAEAVQADLADVGINVEIQSATGPVFSEAVKKRGNVALFLDGWLADYPDPSNFLDVNFHSKNIAEEKSFNRSFYSNPDVDQLLDQAIRETDTTSRDELYQEAERRIVEDAPWAPLFHTEDCHVYQSNVRGYYIPFSRPIIPFDRIWLEE